MKRFERLRRTLVLGGIAGALCTVCSPRAEAQLGSLVSPGRLARPHASLEGLSNCTKCHQQGRKVTAEKCLACHKAIAERVMRKSGVHRAAAGDCVRCHVEHAGENGELRPFETKAFDHGGVAGFPLDGRHARLACESCHKTRSFLTLTPTCGSCHADVHRGTLGSKCAACHSARVAFKETPGFDHGQSAFPLTGTHRTVPCARCHANGIFKGLKFAACTDCHREPHRQAFGPTCTTCHTTDNWHTSKVDHRRTEFPLLGRHVGVRCAACHKQPPLKVKPRADTCAACHVDVHRGAFKQDCKACHTENGFGNAPFDHASTAFPLSDKHATLPCRACHKNPAGDTPAARRVADFRGLTGACASCHADVHRGELGPRCESCHSAATFKVRGYVHPQFPGFFAGAHAPLACDKCHVRPAPDQAGVASPVLFKNVSTACASCHRDVHLGQEGQACETCHAVRVPGFGLSGFNHDRAAFPLTGRHQTTPCAQCHRRESGLFPAGAGTAVRYKGTSAECRSCHADVHLGQLDTKCEVCHTPASFSIPGYTHRGVSQAEFFVGRHRTPACQACHKKVTDQFPAGSGTAIRFKVGTRCVACHTDVHRGALGPRCGDCHKP